MREAAQWYDQRTPGLGLRFLDAIEAATDRVADMPHSGAVWRLAALSLDASVRRFPLSTFPYTLVYTADAAGVLVVAVAHGRRRPGYWTQRIRQ